MKAVAVTKQEGGLWVPFSEGCGIGGVVHSIVFDNGCVWDTVSGWRYPARREALPRIRIKMGRSVV